MEAMGLLEVNVQKCCLVRVKFVANYSSLIKVNTNFIYKHTVWLFKKTVWLPPFVLSPLMWIENFTIFSISIYY